MGASFRWRRDYSTAVAKYEVRGTKVIRVVGPTSGAEVPCAQVVAQPAAGSERPAGNRYAGAVAPAAQTAETTKCQPAAVASAVRAGASEAPPRAPRTSRARRL